MSKNPADANFYEQTLIQLFQEMGYQYECGYDVERDFCEPHSYCHSVLISRELLRGCPESD